MKLEELYENIGTDFQLDKNELGDESIRSSKLFVKYIRIWSEESLKVETYNLMLKDIIHKRYNFYKGNGTPEENKADPAGAALKLSTDTAIMRYVDVDSEVYKVKQQIIIQKQKVEVLKACLLNIKDRNYQIKAALDHLRFLSGA